jgi:hypothetical protein
MARSRQASDGALRAIRAIRADGARVLALIVAFLVADNALSLALWRRPFHDTAGELLAWRIWVSDLIRAGDWPFWFPYARYGFPLTTLHYAPAVWSPVGLIAGALARADVLALVVENLGWKVVGIAGCYVFARRHLTWPLSAAAAAVAYAGSGPVAVMAGGGSIGGSLLAAAMLAPWLLVCVERLLGARDWRAWCRSTGVLAMVTAAWVSNGYPGLWLTGPVLVAPYALCMATSVRALGRLILGAVVAGALAAGMLALFVADTLRLPLFAAGLRDAMDPRAGAFAGPYVLGFWLANPAYLTGVSEGYPLAYAGVIPMLLLAASVPAQALRLRAVRPILLTAAACLLVLVLSASTSERGALQLIPLIVLLLVISSLPVAFRRWERADAALALVGGWALIAASANPLGDWLRSSIPPFSLVRWNYYYLWLTILSLVIIAWRTAEQVAARAPALPPAGVPRLKLAAGTLAPLAAPLAVISLLAAQLPAFADRSWPDLRDVGEERIGTIQLRWAIGWLATWLVAAASALFLRPRCPRLRWFGLEEWIGVGALILLAITVTSAALLGTDEALVRGFTPLPPSGRYLLDVAQLLLVLVALAVVVLRAPSWAAVVRVAAIVSVLDAGLASARYLSSFDYALNSQASPRYPRDVSFSFSGRGRDEVESGATSYQRMWQLVVKRPALAPWPQVQPHVAAFDHRLGEPTAFAWFAYFPESWEAGGDGREVIVGPERLRGQDGASSGPGQSLLPPGTRRPVCPPASQESALQSDAIVRRLLSSVVYLDVRSDCERLLVFMDSWAPDWQVSIDGRLAAPLRVDGAVRGVIVPAGRHEVVWRYRPVHLPALLGVMGVSALVCLVLIVAPYARLAPLRSRRQERGRTSLPLAPAVPAGADLTPFGRGRAAREGGPHPRRAGPHRTPAPLRPTVRLGPAAPSPTRRGGTTAMGSAPDGE